MSPVNPASSREPHGVLRVGFVPGVEPDRFARRWASGDRPARLELVPLPASRALIALEGGEVDMCFVRLPLPTSAAEALHAVALWEEQPVVMVGAENTLSLHEELREADLAGETEIPAADPDDAAGRAAVVATGIGYTRMPMSLARLHHRKDAVHRPAPDRDPTRIALVWPREADDAIRQELVGVVRGRTARSGRSPRPEDAADPSARGAGRAGRPAGGAPRSGAAPRSGGGRRPGRGQRRGGGRSAGR